LPDEYTDYGVLLGLSDDEGGNRTLWIRPFDGQLRVNEISNAIVFPYQEGFGWLRNYQRDIDISDPYDPELTNTLIFSKLLLGVLGEDASPILDTFASAQNYWEHSAWSTDVLYYVGDKYVCYVNHYYSGGGSYAWYHEYARTVPLEAVNKFSPVSNDNPPDRVFSAYFQPEQINLGDLLSNDLLRSCGALSAFDYTFESRESLDFNNLALVHGYGRWHVAVPVLNYRYNPGDSGGSVFFESFLPLSVKLPNSLTGFNEWPEEMVYSSLLWWDTITDTVAAPDFKGFVFLSDEDIGIIGSDGRPLSSILTTPAHPNERIVSVRWAAPEDIPAWESALSPYFSK